MYLRAALLFLLLSACERVPPGALASHLGEGGGGGDACEGASRDGAGTCRGPDGRVVPDVCCPPVDVPRCELLDRESCEADTACRWLVPGCEEPALPAEGCFPAAECRAGACAAGLECRAVQVDPCAGRPCKIAVCAIETRVCLPPAPCSGTEVRSGVECRDADGVPRPPRCCTWRCTSNGIMCAMVPPECPEGEVPAIAGGCWGPCIPPDRCEEAIEEKLCVATGGTWELGCGHTRCGVEVDCIVAFPGCHCGDAEVFEPGAGCRASDACFAGPGEPCGRAVGKRCQAGLTCVPDAPGSAAGVCRAI